MIQNIESWNELQEQLQRKRKEVSVFPPVMQWKRQSGHCRLSKQKPPGLNLTAFVCGLQALYLL
jgi:hypothetical protein